MMSWMRRIGLAAETKRSALVFIFASVLLTALIGAGLGFLDFKPGMPLPSFESDQVTVQSTESAPVGMPVNAFAVIVILIVVGILLIVLVVQVVRGVEWKKLLAGFISLLWKVILITAVFALIASLLPKSEAALPAASMPAPLPPITAPLGHTPSILLWLSGIVLFALVVFLGVRLIAEKRGPTVEQWETAAGEALQALRAGEDVRKVILLCYRRMSRALREERNIEREAFMTTGEFELLLTAKGVPRDPIHRLTALFEAVRYGRGQPTSSEEEDALHCLEAILSYSRAGGLT